MGTQGAGIFGDHKKTFINRTDIEGEVIVKKFPTRLSVMTLNLWREKYWEQRQDAIRHFFHRFQPDVLCVQEIREQSRNVLDEILPQYKRIHDNFPGWVCESNIYWKSELFEEVEHGFENVGILEEYRRLFWVRLRLRNLGHSIFVGTAHLTYKAHLEEIKSGYSPRLSQIRKIVSVLKILSREHEPTFLMGDFNDDFHPIHILFEAGYESCFGALGVQSPPTWPSCPSLARAVNGLPAAQVLDWIVSNNYARAIVAQVPQFVHKGIAPSDHWPVIAMYEFLDKEP